VSCTHGWRLVTPGGPKGREGERGLIPSATFPGGFPGDKGVPTTGRGSGWWGPAGNPSGCGGAPRQVSAGVATGLPAGATGRAAPHTQPIPGCPSADAPLEQPPSRHSSNPSPAPRACTPIGTHTPDPLHTHRRRAPGAP